MQRKDWNRSYLEVPADLIVDNEPSGSIVGIQLNLSHFC